MSARRLEPRDRRTVLIVVVATQLVLALLTGLTVSYAYGRVDDIGAGDPIPHRGKKPAIGGDALNVLVLGSDSRVGAGNDLDGQTDIGQRADTTILVHVSADRQTVYGVSLPRDALVDRPECTDAQGDTVPAADDVMFNDAFSVGGPTCTVAMVQDLTGVYIDHYVVVDFAGFKDMVDAVDGVTVCIPEDIDDSEHGITFQAGTQTLDGQKALDYVRERSSTPNADIGRMKRQQAFIASMVSKVVSAGTLSKPTRVFAFLRAATASIVTDPELDSLRDLGDLALQFRKTGLDDITFVTVPIAEAPSDPNRLVWTDQAQGLWKAITADQPLPARYRDGSISAAETPGTPSATASGSSPSASPGTTSSASPSDGATSAAPTEGPTQQETEEQAAQNGLCA
ncbi:LCP family glycopolymer transferase [Nocardioides flavescens]|uniref:LCP family glycopolymer transferase n=1 Tax=Nocardioides flavescens TaxID=2691959 RepID=UPI00136B7E26